MHRPGRVNDLLTIERVDHRIKAVAAAILELQRIAYAQEAVLLQLDSLPGLERSAAQLAALQEHFHVAHRSGKFVGAVSVEPPLSACQPAHIVSLVVHPEHQRLGIATALLRSVLQACGAGAVSVSTADANLPALGLYARLGFVRVSQRRLPHSRLRLVLLTRPPTAQDADCAVARATRQIRSACIKHLGHRFRISHTRGQIFGLRRMRLG